ncbi:NADPH-dependent FMN reductase [Novosphingobium aquae]|uniref:NADPH-dependent FMN reductase n=1 Tax=Novosphingobium aquae TaxID=3133435 RepID=A0ABU8SAT6_9SPHN
MSQPHFVAIGGTTRPGSSTERALASALGFAEALGARTTLLGAEAIALPHYAPEKTERSAEALRLVETVRDADALIIGSPGYHGALSGLVKNALDYIEDTSRDERCYLSGIPVGCLATAAGWQAAVATMNQLRSITHALRGWPTPIGVAINSIPGPDGLDPVQSDAVQSQIRMMVDQQISFLRR